MPYELRAIRIDWHYEQAPVELQPTIVGAAAAIATSDHTLETFREQLEHIATTYPAIVADALVEDGGRAYHLFRVARGRVTGVALEQRCADRLDVPVELPLDEVVTVFDDEVPLQYPDLDELRGTAEAVAEAVDAPTRYVAETAIDGRSVRYLVEVAPGQASVRELVFVEERALADRLLRGDYVVPPRSRFPREPSGRYDLPLYLPEQVLSDITAQAMRTDRSLSWIVQSAWKLAKAKIARTDRDAFARMWGGRRDAPKRKQTLIFPGDMLDQLEDEAARLETSTSHLAQVAYALARPQIAK